VLIFLLVLIALIISLTIEENLEIFLLINGILAMTVASFADIPGFITGWRGDIVIES